MSSFLDRYRAGERVQVWAELQACGENLPDEAWAVACETMRRARQNVETITARLREAKYQFSEPDWAWVPATAADVESLREIEVQAGPIPLSLRAWYEIVGSVWWTGTHPSWKTFAQTDALVMNPVDYLSNQCQEWFDEREKDGEPFEMDVSPDRLHKADISGGPAYAIACGVRRADGDLLYEQRRLTFVPYLRVCFEHGGFPGFQGTAAGDNALVKRLSEGLLEI